MSFFRRIIYYVQLDLEQIFALFYGIFLFFIRFAGAQESAWDHSNVPF